MRTTGAELVRQVRRWHGLLGARPAGGPRSPAGRGLEGVRAAYGLVQLAAPALLADRVAPDRVGPRARVVIRVLGARHLLQAGAASAVDRPSAHQVGAVVDALHALSMVALSFTGRGRRRLAVLDACVAGTFAALEALVALGPPEPLVGSGAWTRGGGPASLKDPATPGARSATPHPPAAPPRAPTQHPPVQVEPDELTRLDQRRQHDALLQAVVAEVFEDSGGESVSIITDRLRDAMAARGLTPTDYWLDAVARDAAAGALYVVSSTSREDAGLVQLTEDSEDTGSAS